MKSKEELLVKNIKQNPLVWYSECLDINIKTAKSDDLHAELSVSVKVNLPEDDSSSSTSNTEDQFRVQNIRRMVKRVKKHERTRKLLEYARTSKKRLGYAFRRTFVNIYPTTTFIQLLLLSYILYTIYFYPTFTTFIQLLLLSYIYYFYPTTTFILDAS